MTENFWKKAAETISNAGSFPLLIGDTIIDLLKILLTEDQAKFIQVFNPPSLNIDQLKEKVDLDDQSLNEMLNGLMAGGIITGTQNSSGDMVYRLMSFFPGMFEFSLMKGETGEKEKRLVRLFEKLFDDISQMTKENYEQLAPIFRQFPPIDRVVPVEREIDVKKDVVLPSEEASKLIDNNHEIAVAYCYCRHEKAVLNDPCKVKAPVENCLLLGKSAKFAIQYGFARSISKDDAKKILHEAEDYGLVHKIFHAHQNPEKNIEGICSCCKCCCGTFQLHRRGAMPFHTRTSYIAIVVGENCTACGTCVEMCPMETIELEDNVVKINRDKCIGCGICAHHCDEDVLKLERTDPRNVFILPVKAIGN